MRLSTRHLIRFSFQYLSRAIIFTAQVYPLVYLYFQLYKPSPPDIALLYGRCLTVGCGISCAQILSTAFGPCYVRSIRESKLQENTSGETFEWRWLDSSNCRSKIYPTGYRLVKHLSVRRTGCEGLRHSSVPRPLTWSYWIMEKLWIRLGLYFFRLPAEKFQVLNFNKFEED